jgi:Xaa-Pro aminopeptidase
MSDQHYKKRLEKVSHHMKETGLDVLLLTKPSNMFYLTGDGRLCAFTMIT